MAFDRLFKHLWRDTFNQYDIQANVVVGTLDLMIDLVLTQKPGTNIAATPSQVLPDIVPRLAQTNIFEFKSARDKVPQHALHKLVGYESLYCFQKKVPFECLARDVAIWFVTTVRPRFLDALLAADLARVDVQGVYRINFSFALFVVVINEIPCVEANYPLLLLASGAQLLDAMRLLKRGHLFDDPNIQKYMYESYLLNYDELKSMTETEIKWPADVKRNIRAAIEDLGLKEVIDAIGLKEVIDAIGLKEVIDAVGIDKVEQELKRIKAAKSQHKGK